MNVMTTVPSDSDRAFAMLALADRVSLGAAGKLLRSIGSSVTEFGKARPHAFAAFIDAAELRSFILKGI